MEIRSSRIPAPVSWPGSGPWWIWLGIIIGAVFLGISELDFKWFAILFVGLLLGLTGLLFIDKKQFFLSLLVLTIPVIIHINFYYQPSETSRSTYGFQILIVHIPLLFLYAIWALRRINEPRQNQFSTIGLIPLGILFIWSFISIYLSRSPLYGFFDLFSLVFHILFFIYASNQIITIRELRLVAGLLVLSSAIQGSLAIAQYLTDSNLMLEFFGAIPKTLRDYKSLSALSRAAGTLVHPNNLARFFDLLIPMIFCLLFYPTTFFRKLFLWLVFLISCLGLMVTLSRGGMSATAISIIILLTIILSRRQGWFPTIVHVILIVSLMTIVILGTTNPVQKRFIEHDYGTAYGRLPHNKVAWNMIKDNPIFGVGLNNYMDAAPYYDNTPEQIISVWETPVHNLYLFITVELGIIGLLLHLLFVFIVIKASWPALSSENDFIRFFSLGLLGGLLASFVHGMVDYQSLMYASIYWFILGLAVSLGRFAARVQPITASENSL